MYKITSNLGTGAVCQMFFIFFCSIFMSENMFSRPHWEKEYMEVLYNQDDNSITFNFLFYDYHYVQFKMYGCLYRCDFLYSEDGTSYNFLMRAETKPQQEKDLTWITMTNKKTGARIQLLNSYNPEKGTFLPDKGRELHVEVNSMNALVTAKQVYMSVKWYLPSSCKCIKSIEIVGNWIVQGEVEGDKFHKVYTPTIVKLNSNTMKNIPSALNSKIYKNKKVTSESDAIIEKELNLVKISRFIMFQG